MEKEDRVIVDKQSINTKINKEIAAIRLNDSKNELKYYEDGIINSDLYSIAKQKILWILKETSTDFNVRSFYRKENCFTGNKSRTFKPVAECAHMILYNNFSDNNALLSKTMQEIAIINIKKTPGKKKSNNKELKTSYADHKDLIISQVALINPDIIIFGNTIQYLFSDIKLVNCNKFGYTFSKEDPDLPVSIGTDKHKYYMYSNKLLISTWHPNRRITGLTNSIYATAIGKAYTNWLNVRDSTGYFEMGKKNEE